MNYISYKHVLFGQQTWMFVGCATFAFLMSLISFLLIEKPSLVLARWFMGDSQSGLGSALGLGLRVRPVLAGRW